MTKISDYPDGWDVEEAERYFSEVWHKTLNVPKYIPVTKMINGIQHRLYEWSEVKEAVRIDKYLEFVKQKTGSRHVSVVSIGKKYRGIYIA